MEKESRLKDFLANPYKSMWKMALPIIAGMMVQTLFNVVDIMFIGWLGACLLYTSPSPRDQRGSRMPSSA